MSDRFQFAETLRFWPAIAAELLAAVPGGPGIFALFGERAEAQPYLARTADLRRRMGRMLLPPAESDAAAPSKRLDLRARVHTIAWTRTGSEFESLLLMADATAALFGPDEARRRLRLRVPYCLRLTLANPQPRLYVTNRLSARALPELWGPFPSRGAAERMEAGVLDLFRLRRCFEDLDPHPEHPGCVYGEMRRCMAPCNLTASADEYRAEATRVEAFLRTRGASLLGEVAAWREEASEAMDFERAAQMHERHTRVAALAAEPGELVRNLPQLRAVIVQAAAPRLVDGEAAQEANLFLVAGGSIVGPERLSTLGVRAVKEQTSVGSSLFAQPLMLEAVPLEGEARASESPEARAAEVLDRLAARVADASTAAAGLAALGDHLSLLRRWFHRPEKQRAGEIFFPNPDGTWPVRRILRAAARAALGDPKPMAETRRDEAPAAKQKILHEGREGVERAVPAAKPRRPGRGVVSAETLDTETVVEAVTPRPGFRTRRAQAAQASSPLEPQS